MENNNLSTEDIAENLKQKEAAYKEQLEKIKKLQQQKSIKEKEADEREVDQQNIDQVKKDLFRYFKPAKAIEKIAASEGATYAAKAIANREGMVFEEEKIEDVTSKESEGKKYAHHFTEAAKAVANREGMAFGELVPQKDDPKPIKKSTDLDLEHTHVDVLGTLADEIAVIDPAFANLDAKQKEVVLDFLPSRLHTHIEDEARKRFSQRLDTQTGIKRMVSGLWKNTIIAAHEKEVYVELGGDVSRKNTLAKRNQEYTEAKKIYNAIPKSYKKEYEKAVKDFNTTGVLVTNNNIDAYIEAEKALINAKTLRPSLYNRLTAKLPEAFSSIWKQADRSLTDAEVALNRENFLKDSMSSIVTFVEKTKLKTQHTVDGKTAQTLEGVAVIDYTDLGSFKHLNDKHNSALKNTLLAFNTNATNYAHEALYEYQTNEASPREYKKGNEVRTEYAQQVEELREVLTRYAQHNHYAHPKLFVQEKIAEITALVETTRLLNRIHNPETKIKELETKSASHLASNLKLNSQFTEQNRLARAGKIQKGAESLAGMGSIKNHIQRLDDYFDKLHVPEKLARGSEKKYKEAEKKYKHQEEIIKEAVKKIHEEIAVLQKDTLNPKKVAAAVADKENEIGAVRKTIDQYTKALHTAAEEFNTENKKYVQLLSELATRVEFMKKKYEGGQLALGTDPLVQAVFFAKLTQATQALEAESEHQKNLLTDSHFKDIYETPVINNIEYLSKFVREQYILLPKSNVYTRAENLENNRGIRTPHNVRNLLSLDNDKYIVDERLNDELGRFPDTPEKITTRNIGVGEQHQARVYQGMQNSAVNETHMSTRKKLSPEMLSRISERSTKEAEVTVEKYLQGGVSSPEWTLFLKDIPAKDFLSGTMEPDLQPLYKPLYTYLNTLSAGYEGKNRGVSDLEAAKEHMSTYDYIRYLFAKKDVTEQNY